MITFAIIEVTMKIPILREYGSWAVFILSSASGIAAGLSSGQWRGEITEIIFTILGMALLINSKNPFSSLVRASWHDRSLLWFMLFALSGIAFLIPFLAEGLKAFLPFFLLIFSYLILLSIKKEHHLITELNGFALLTISAPVVYFVVASEMSIRLYLAVLIFFTASVFRVRMKIRRAFAYRLLMFIYCIIAITIFVYLKLSLFLLLPLIENIASAFWLRKETLRRIGDIELAKGVVFLILFAFFWK